MPTRRIKANIMELFDGAETIILDADAAASSSTITVQSIIGVSTDDILFFREPGNEKAEIVAVHTSTPPSGNTVTLASNTVEAHPAGTKIYIINADQVRFFTSATEDDANSNDGNLTALAAAQNIDPTLINNIYDDTTQTSGFYYYRFQNSVSGVNLLYSDPIPWGQVAPQFSDNEVGYILEFVKRKKQREWDEKFSKETAIDEINACLRFMQKKLKHWSEYLVPDDVLGQTSRGVFDYALTGLSATIYDDDSNKSVLSVRIGRNQRELIPKDEKEFDNLKASAKHTQVRTQATIGGTTLEVDNSYDFDDDGTVSVFSSNTEDEITYTGVTRSATAGVFTGVPASGDGAIGATHAVDTNVWQDHEEGEPRYFNIRQGRLRIWPLPSDDWINKNVYMDFWQEVTNVDSESDSIDAERYDMIKHWLLWKADSYWFNNGNDDLDNADWKIFSQILSDTIRTSMSGQKFKMKPKLNTIAYRGKDNRFDYK